MSEFDYIHGAAAQGHISNFIHAEQTEQLVIKANLQIDRAVDRARQAEAENAKLRADLQSAKRTIDQNRDFSLASLKIRRAGHDRLELDMQREAMQAHDFVLSWIDHYGNEVSHEFIEGTKEGMKMRMPFSTSEALRYKFIRGFEDQANAIYRAQGENALTREAFDKIASGVALHLLMVLRYVDGARYTKPVPGVFGPERMKERYGEGNFKAQDFITKD